MRVWDGFRGPESARSSGVRITRLASRLCRGPLVRLALRRCPTFRGHLALVGHHARWNHWPATTRFVRLERYSKQAVNRRVKAWLTFESMGYPMATPASPRWSPLPDGFGSLLRTARARAGLSRTRLAAALDVSYGLVHDLEAGLRPPSATIAGRISEALRLDPWESAVVQATAVEDEVLRTRRGTRHTHPRRSPARAIRVPTPGETCR